MRNLAKERTYKTALYLPQYLTKYDSFILEEIKREKESHKKPVYLKDAEFKIFQDGQRVLIFDFAEVEKNKKDLMIFQQVSKEKFEKADECKKWVQREYPFFKVKDIGELGRVWLVLIKKPEKK